MVTALLAGCTKNSPLAPEIARQGGRLSFAMEAADNIVSGTVTLSKEAITQVQRIIISNHTGSVSFEGIQVGNWTIRVQLYDPNGTEIYSGEGTAVVHKNQTTTATIRVDHNTGNLQIVVEAPETAVMEKIIFFKDFTGIFCTINSDGAEVRELMTFPTTDVLKASNYRGGSELVFSAYSSTSNNDVVYLMNLDGSNLHSITDQVRDPRWSWDGNRIGATKGIEAGLDYYSVICVFNPDGSGQQVFSRTNGEGSDGFGCWTPDNRILYHHVKEPGQMAIYISTLDGEMRTRLTDYSAASLNVSDCSADFKAVGTIDGDVYLLNLNGFELKRLTTQRNVLDPTFSADGQRIVYCRFSDDSGSFDLYSMQRDGSDVRRITNTPEGEFAPHFIY